MTWLFCYGSNHPSQLAERLGRTDFKMMPGRLIDHWRTFRGFSVRWDGGVASVEPQKGYSVYGYLAQVTNADLALMDRFEGVASGKYKRVGKRVDGPNGKEQAVVYVSTSDTFNKPRREYLETVAMTINSFWSGAGGQPVKWNEIPIR